MKPRVPRDGERTKRMAELYRSGLTLQKIGDQYGLTRERVRQLIGTLGLSRNSGGQALHSVRRALDKRASILAREEHRYQKWLGLSKAAYMDLTGQEWSWSRFKRKDAAKNPGSAFMQQKRNAPRRGIAWDLTFSDWWRIWQESGKWHLRGRGKGYCMARYGDSGPYSVENVYICTIGQNFSDSYLVRPWNERFPLGFAHGQTRSGRGFSVGHDRRQKKNPFQLYIGKKYSGVFPTREAAEQAGLQRVAA